MTDNEFAGLKAGVERAQAAFDALAEMSYYGAAFRATLRHNPEAMEAAEKLVEVLRKELPGDLVRVGIVADLRAGR